jgi:hypothetical protein
MLRMRLGIALLVLCSPLLAANGSFHFGKVKFEPVDAFAFQVDTKDPAKPITVVALTSFKIDRPAVVDAIDPGNALVVQTAEAGNVVFVRLVPPDRCGIAGYLASTGKQIDLGESFSAKTTASSASRIAGECASTKPGKMFDDAYDFRLPYDTAITAIPKPAPIPADGGEPGKTYLALVKAIQSSDWDVAHVRLPKDQVPEARPKTSEMKNFFEGLALNYPKTAKVTGGLMKGDRANIEIRGIDHDGKKIKGTVAMQKVSGQWRVLDQSMYFDEM